jgi:ATP-dependent RNA helicase HelY
MTLPKRVEHRQPRVRRDLASALRSAAAGMSTTGERRGKHGESRDVDPELASLREKMRRHPVHREADRETRVRIAERYLRIERDNAALQKKVAAATNSLARTFDRIVGLLTERGFIELTDGTPTVTDDGRLLARIYSESDLLVAECLRSAVLSAVLYETRGGDGPGAPRNEQVPTAQLRQALTRTRRLSAELRADEHRHRITLSREPDDGFVAAIYRWASSGDLVTALAASDNEGNGSPLSPGDFVRWCRQVLDLLDQVRNAAPQPVLRATAKRAIDAIRRGVVAVDAG